MPLRLLPLVLFATVASAATIDSDTRRLSRDIFKQLKEQYAEEH